MSRPEPQVPLFHPFAIGDLALPGEGSRGLLLGATSSLLIPAFFRAELVCVQGFRPDFLRLEKQGRTVTQTVAGSDFDLALILADRHRGRNEAWLAEGIGRVKQGGLVVIAGLKTDGVGSLRKRLQDVVPLDGHLSKSHGFVFWLCRTPEADGFAAAVSEWSAQSPLVENRFLTAPGMFSAGRVDPGSQLLADSLPTDLKGAVADFCSGWGYLAARVADSCPAVAEIDLYEADHASLEASRRNAATASRPDLPLGFHWTDLATEAPAKTYDAILMNPPFHRGRAAEPDLGRTLIGRAASALKRGGRLFLVANRGLPYEAALSESFARSGELARDASFKALWAIR